MPTYTDLSIGAPPTIYELADRLSEAIVDQTVAIQAMIDSVPNGAPAIIRFPPGHFHCAVGWGIFNHDNITIEGAGIDKTIIDFTVLAPLGASVPPAYAAMSVIEGTWGHIMVDTTSFNTVVKNPMFRGLTLKVSSSSSIPASTKALVVGTTESCIVENFKLDGGYWEGVYHFDKNGNINPNLSKNWIVRNCEMTNGRSSAINSNNQNLAGYSLADNYIHDGGYGLGVLMVGKNGIIRHNRLINAAYISIAESLFKNIIIDGNEIIEPTASGFAAVYGVFVEQDPTINANDSVQIVNNIFDGLDATVAAIAVRVIGGNCRVAGNIFKGRRNGVAGSATGIQVSPAQHGGGGLVQIVDNQFESLVAGVSDYNYAIVVAGAGMSAFIDGNALGANVGANGWLYNDANAKVYLGTNVFSSPLYLEAVNTWNTDGKMNNIPTSIKDLRFTLPENATPNVAGKFKFGVNFQAPGTITNFLDGFDGQTIELYFYGTNCTIQSNTNIRLAGGANFVSSRYDSLTLTFLSDSNIGPTWVEVDRSVNA